ncbi:MAG: hypothetical protein KBA30_09490 [Clostridia bacterium]|nr:hypothetical protein [Clostridia bacterium]
MIRANAVVRTTPFLAVNTGAHFCVDFGCFVILFGGFAPAAGDVRMIAYGFLVYNILAFGLQPFIGYASDVRPRIPVSVFGCILLCAGLLLTSFPWISLAVCALGNACFHVGGGIDSLVNARGRMARSGVFVSSGALGVGLGTLAGKTGCPVWVPLLLAAGSAAAIAICCPYPHGDAPRRSSPFRMSAARPFGIVLALCAASVFVRAYVGSVLPLPWKTAVALPLIALLPSIMSASGKAGGGFLADRLGARRVGVGSLLASLPLLVFGYADPFACAAGILMFNMSMSITLCGVASELPDHPGLAFGLTTLALAAGGMPAVFIPLPSAAAPTVMAVCILVSAVCLGAAVTNTTRRSAT